MQTRSMMLAAAASVGLGSLCASAAIGGSGDPPSYTVEFLGPGIVVNDMNETGEVVGWTISGGVQAFIAGPEHPWELLPLPDGYSSAWAQGINDAGVVVGSAAMQGSPEFGQAVSWTPDGDGGYDIEFLGQLPGHTQSIAFDINNRGDIIGFSIIPGFQGGPTVWFNAPQGVLNIGELGAPGSPKEINDQGIIVGINGGLFDIDTMEMTPLPPFPDNMNAFQGWAINEHNEIAGTAFFGGFVTRSASNWTIEHGWQSLGGIFNASAQIIAFDINDDATTVMQTPQPAAYFEGLGTFSLSSLVADEQQGQWLFFANQGAAVNNAGQIANIVTHQPTGQSGVGIMTPVASTPVSDLNGDGVVDGADLAILLGAWGACPLAERGADGGDCGACPADLNTDCAVNGADLAILLGNWG